MRSFGSGLSLAFVLGCLLSSAGVQAAPGEVAVALRELSKPAQSGEARAGDAAQAAMAAWYQQHDNAPAWVGDDGLSARGKAILEAIGGASAHGLDPAAYQLADIEAAKSGQSAADKARLDWLLTRALLAYAADLSVGRVNGSAVDANIEVVQRRPDYAKMLHEVAGAADPAAWLEAQAPATPQYKALKDALAVWREKASTAKFTAVSDDGSLLRPGQRDPRVPTIRRRLGEIEGLSIEPAGPDAQVYDEKLAEQVKRYQARLGLSVDGIIGPRTIESLSASPADRVNQIIVNMERRRWVPEVPGPRYVRVNIADYSMIFVDGGKTAFETKVIVGTPKDPSPELTSVMRGFQTNPYWTVPQSIAGEEYLPMLRRDPTSLQKQGMHIFASWSDDNSEIDPSSVDWNQVNGKAFPYRIRQDAGAGNALGYIFFPFANKYGIYMHDTASRFLFGEGSRNFSHGCIRVQNPLDYVVAVFRNRNGVTRERVEAAIQNQVQTSFVFPEPVPLYIVYQTVIPRADGSIDFRDDVYGRDKRVFKALTASR